MLEVFLLFSLLNIGFICGAYEAPILDVDRTVGYHGKINEKHVLVDMVPHLQVKNIESINGICEYHVYKPNSEEFPFTIEIKDKSTGESIIQLDDDGDDGKKKKVDCKIRRFYTFFIEAHDCSEPSLASGKVPVSIEVIDMNDHKLVFEQSDVYRTILVNQTSKNFLLVKATDDDCTNDGKACAYKILEESIPFTVDELGFLSNTVPLAKSRYDFTVRAFDCLDDESYVDANIHIDVDEQCVPVWQGYNQVISISAESTPLFEKLQFAPCNTMDSCVIENIEVSIKLDLNSYPNGCEIDKCGEVLTKTELMTGADIDETNQPMSFQSFSKNAKHSEKSNFDGNFGNIFTIKSWLRRNSLESSQHDKEHVFCGTDSESQNRHHYGLYFYRGNIKFLLRKEHQDSMNGSQNSKNFYSSLWEWFIGPFDTDGQWHLYEVKVDYPNVNLYIDGVKFETNTTNSDIIDAYEFDSTNDTGTRVTFIGACYHARSKSLTDFFEGDIASVNLYRADSTKSIECIKNCKEYIEISLNGNEDYTKSIENAQHSELTIQANTISNMIDMLSKLHYINKNILTNMNGKRYVGLMTSIKCVNNDKKLVLDPIKLEINVNKIGSGESDKNNVEIRLDGDKQVMTTVADLARGVLVFDDISINTIVSDNTIDGILDGLYLSKCIIRVEPYISEDANKEKFMYSENLNTNEQFKFIDGTNTVTISGKETCENYEYFLKNLVYSYEYSELIGNSRLFYLTCIRDDTQIETNTILIRVNISAQKDFVALKQINKFAVPDDDVIETELQGPIHDKNNFKASSPFVVVMIVASVGLIAFSVAYAVFKLKTSHEVRRNLTNEENPQMEWDDSGLNIIENPLLKVVEKLNSKDQQSNDDQYDVDYSSTEDDSDDDQNYTDDEPEKLLDRELEWDTSALEINAENKLNLTVLHG